MTDHDAHPAPAAASVPPGGVLLPAAVIRDGDVLAYDGVEVTVTSVTSGTRIIGGRPARGLAIDWEVGSRSGRMFRDAYDVMRRVRKAGGAA